MSGPPLCACPESPATVEDRPDNMHVHGDCCVYHHGKECTMQPAQPSLPLEKP